MLQDALNKRLLEVSMELHKLRAEKEWILERLDHKPPQETAHNSDYAKCHHFYIKSIYKVEKCVYCGHERHFA